MLPHASALPEIRIQDASKKYPFSNSSIGNMLNLRTQQQEKEFFELSELPFPTLPQKSPGSWKFSVASNLPCLFNVGNGLKIRPSLVQGFVRSPETMRNGFPIFVQLMWAAAK